MRESGMIRVRRALGAMKQAEMARLAATRRASNAALSEARDLRQSSASQPARVTAADMLATSQWQVHAEAKARLADQRAKQIAHAAKPLEQALARTIGREAVVERVIEDYQTKHKQVLARRTEG